MSRLTDIRDIINKIDETEDSRAEAVLAIAGMMPRFEQIAFYAPDMEQMKRSYKRIGCVKWVDDIVTAEGLVNNIPSINVARLAFNYDLGIELELIRYEAGRNWHSERLRVDVFGRCEAPFLSHLSYHVDDIDEELKKSPHFKVIQDVCTINHTNPFLISSGRRYRYVILDTRNMLGFDVKFIQRFEAPQNAE